MAYSYLLVDARYEYARVEGRVVNQGVQIVKGGREDGKRDTLAVGVADSESKATTDRPFKHLKDGGLKGLQLVTSGNHKGLVAAIQRHFQGASWQCCNVHRQLIGAP